MADFKKSDIAAILRQLDSILIAQQREVIRSHASALGRLGGIKGGVARAAVLTPARRQEISSQAAKARWKGKKRRA